MSGHGGFELIGSAELYRGRVFSLVDEIYRSPDGEEFDRQIVRNPGAVAIVARHDDDTIVLLHQFRPALGHFIWEIPAGLCDKPGEERGEAAARELREEAGLEASTWTELLTIAPAPGMTDETITVFLAEGLTQVGHEADGPEERHLVRERVAVSVVREMIAHRQIVDGKTIVGVLALDLFRK